MVTKCRTFHTEQAQTMNRDQVRTTFFGSAKVNTSAAIHTRHPTKERSPHKMATQSSTCTCSMICKLYRNTLDSNSEEHDVGTKSTTCLITCYRKRVKTKTCYEMNTIIISWSFCTSVNYGPQIENVGLKRIYVQLKRKEKGRH